MALLSEVRTNPRLKENLGDFSPWGEVCPSNSFPAKMSTSDKTQKVQNWSKEPCPSGLSFTHKSPTPQKEGARLKIPVVAVPTEADLPELTPPFQGLAENQWVAGIFAPAPGTQAIPSYGFFGSPGRKTVRSQRKPLKNEPGTGSGVGVQGEKGRNSAHLERGAPARGEASTFAVYRL